MFRLATGLYLPEMELPRKGKAGIFAILQPPLLIPLDAGESNVTRDWSGTPACRFFVTWALDLVSPHWEGPGSPGTLCWGLWVESQQSSCLGTLGAVGALDI